MNFKSYGTSRKQGICKISLIHHIRLMWCTIWEWLPNNCITFFHLFSPALYSCKMRSFRRVSCFSMCSCNGHHQSALETAREGNRVKTASATSLPHTILWTCRCGVGHILEAQKKSSRHQVCVSVTAEQPQISRPRRNTWRTDKRGLPEGLKN